MGLFDDLSGNFDSLAANPLFGAMLGATQGLGQASAPSRLPVKSGQVWGDLAAGLSGGMRQALANRQAEAQNAGANIGNIDALDKLNFWRQYEQKPVLSMREVQNGATGDVPQQPNSNGASGGLLSGLANAFKSVIGGTPQTSAANPALSLNTGGGALSNLTPEQHAAVTQALLQQSGDGAGATAPAGQAPGGSPLPATNGGSVQPVPGAPAAPVTAAPSPQGPLNPADMYSSIPPMVLQRMGIQVPPEVTTLWASGIQPGSAEWNTAMRNIAIKGAGIAPVVGGDRAGVPAQSYDLASGTYKPMPGQFQTMEQGAYANSHGSSMGSLGAKEAEDAFQQKVHVAAENQIAKQNAFYTTGVVPPDFNSPNQPAAVSPTGDIATTKGTVVPAPPPQPFAGTDAITKQNANTQQREADFGNVRATLDGTEGRLIALGKALQDTESGGLMEKRAEIANNLRGAGMGPLADFVLSAKDTASVQKAMGLQTLDVLGQLKSVNSGTGGRILNSEFVNLLDKQYGPDLSPSANYTLIGQALGGVYQTRNLIDDYFKVGKPAGWRDANAYQSAYYSNPANSYQNNVDYAEKALGPLKGMPGAPGSAPGKQQVQVGQTGKLKDGTPIRWNGKQWEIIDGGPARTAP